MIKEKIFNNILISLKKIGVKNIDIDLQPPAASPFGDYSTSIALKLTKILKKNPLEISEMIINNFPKTDLIEKVEIVKPGFINFWISKMQLTSQLNKSANNEFVFFTLLDPKKNKVIIEYTDPNPFKEFHIGHLYSNIVGESISRTHEALGCNVKRADYYGDVGMHVAKSVWGLLKKMKEEKQSFIDLKNKNLSERINYLGQAYAIGVISFEKDKNVQEEIKNINYLVYLCGQEYLKDNLNWQPQVDYKQYLRPEFMGELENVKKIYYAGKNWSLEYFENIYKKLGTKFDLYFPESIVGEYGIKIVKENLKKGIFIKSKGAVVFPGENYGLHTRVFINSLGLPTYECKELGLAYKKFLDFPYDKSIIVVGNEIKEYFKVLHKALSVTDPELGKKTTNICTGMVRLPEGKMSSRTGNVVTVENLLEELEGKVKEIIKKQEKFNKKEVEEVSEIVSVAALKYSLLKSSIGQDVVFDLKESLSLEGNSGPYLQYAYVRCQSVLKKSQIANPKSLSFAKASESKQILSNKSEELNLIRKLYQFPEIVFKAGQNYSPNFIATYLYELASQFNLFYQKNPILKAEKETKELRLLITKATANTIKKGLDLLGIKTVEKM